MSLILIVMDDPTLRSWLAVTLRGHGYRALTAAHGRAALLLLERLALAPASIVLDLHTPVMDGAAFRQVQRHHPLLAATPLIVLAEPADLGRAAALGCAAVLPRPIDTLALLAALGRCTAERLPQT